MKTFTSIQYLILCIMCLAFKPTFGQCPNGSSAQQIDIIGLDNLCEGEMLNLSTYPSLPGGDFSSFDNGVTSLGDGTAVFYPQLSGSVVTFNIFYDYTDPVSGCVYRSNEPVTIFPKPEADIEVVVGGTGPNGIVCSNDILSLTGSPINGSFSSNYGGINDFGNGTALVNPVISGSTLIYQVDYAVENEYGCSSEVTENIPVYNCEEECPSLFTSEVSSNVVCSGESVLFTAQLNPVEAEATITVSGNGTTFNMVTDAYGIWSGYAVLENDGCGPVTHNYTIKATCNDGSVIAVQTEDVIVYPSDITQFIKSTHYENGCTVSVEIDPACANDHPTQPNYLEIAGEATQGPAQIGQSGTYTFCFDYYSSSSDCIDDFCLDIPYSCEDGCMISAGVLSGSTYVCSDDFVVANSIGAMGVGSGTDCKLTYVLHDGYYGVGNVYAVNADGVFFNDGSFPYNETLCITAVAGCDILPSGIPNPANTCYDESACLSTVFLAPLVIEATEICDDNVGEFTVTFSVSGGGPDFLPDADTYSVTGSYSNTAIKAGETYVFGPLASGSNYSLNVVSDGKGCTASYASYSNCSKKTPCDNFAGVMSQSVHVACAGDYINTPAYGTIIDSNSNLTYVLHDGQSALGTVYATSSSGTFINDGTLPTNINLYISAVVGPFINGSPDYLNSCTNISLPGTPVRFLDPIIIETDYVCNNSTGTFVVNFTITGGGPSSNTGFYTVTGDWSGQAQAGVNYSITALQDNSIASITVADDGKSCSASATVGPVQCTKLPIELLSCGGEAEQDGNTLKWITASEIENDYFTIERATEGNLNQFEYLSTINGAGTTGEQQNYQFMDRAAPGGISYYRISQTDFDGTTEIVCVTELQRGEHQLNINGIIPNPAIDQIELYDAIGQVLHNQVIFSEKELTQTKINVSDYAHGIYFVQLVSGDQSVTKNSIIDWLVKPASNRSRLSFLVKTVISSNLISFHLKL